MIENQTFPYRIIFIDVIGRSSENQKIILSWDNLKKFFFFEDKAFYCLNQRIILSRSKNIIC